ncbi:MAG: hypothetical protein LBM08_05000 [Dysgonamonadaceae bacterium]|jgi:hypothetical protein|nr:hypothetical protein [Dysgonamonadaceae bacterium]
MKIQSILNIGICLIIGVVFLACKTVTPATNISYVSEKDGTITIRSTGTGNSHERAKIEAEKNAFDALFFRGIPGSSQKVPLIGYDEAGVKKEYAKYFLQFYDQGRYWSFVGNSYPLGKLRDKTLTVDVTVHLRALRTDLEQNGMIRKFGY